MVITPMLPGFGEASWIVGVGILLLQCGLVALALVAGSLGLLVLSVLVGFGMFAMGVLASMPSPSDRDWVFLASSSGCCAGVVDEA